jgi:hypothetical protein
MIRTLTRSRSPHFYRALMFKLLVAGALFYTLWGPLYPIRSVTADALSTSADLLRR